MNRSVVVLGFASLIPTFMAPVATPNDEKLYVNYGETPFLEDVLSRITYTGCRAS
jgi:hypothetical protein